MFSDTFHTVYSGNIEERVPEPVLVQPLKDGAVGMVCKIGSFDFVNEKGKVEIFPVHGIYYQTDTNASYWDIKSAPIFPLATESEHY